MLPSIATTHRVVVGSFGLYLPDKPEVSFYQFYTGFPFGRGSFIKARKPDLQKVSLERFEDLLWKFHRVTPSSNDRVHVEWFSFDYIDVIREWATLDISSTSGSVPVKSLNAAAP